MIEKFSSANDMEDIVLFEAQFAELYSEYNTNFENAMKHFSNMIEKVERRIIDWVRIKEWNDDYEQVHPQKWVKYLSQQIDQWIQPRWQYGWQFCANRLQIIQKELECTFLDYGYGPCYKGDLASDVPKTETEAESEAESENQAERNRVLDINRTAQPELERESSLPQAIISDLVLANPHRILTEESSEEETETPEGEEEEEGPPPEDWKTPITKSQDETDAAAALLAIEEAAMDATKKIMNDFTATDGMLDTLKTNYADSDWVPSEDDSYKYFPAGVSREDIATEIDTIIKDRAEFKDMTDKYRAWKQHSRIDRDWKNVVNDIARVQAATIAATYTSATVTIDGAQVPVDFHKGSTYNEQMQEHYMVNTGSSLRDRTNCFMQSNQAIVLNESVWIGDTSESFGGAEIANTLFFDIVNRASGAKNRQNFMNRDYRYIGVACSVFTDFALASLTGKKVCVFVFIGSTGHIKLENKKEKRHCYSKVLAEVNRGFKRNDVNKIPQFVSDSDRLCKATQYGKIVDKGYLHTVKLKENDPGFVGQDWTEFSEAYKTKVDAWRTQEYPTTLSVVQKVQHIMNVFALMRNGLDVHTCRRKIELMEYYVKHNHFNGVYQDARLNGFLLNIFDFNKKFDKDTASKLLTATNTEVNSNLKILVDYKFFFKECSKDEQFLDDVPDHDCQTILQNPPQIQEGHSYDGRL